QGPIEAVTERAFVVADVGIDVEIHRRDRVCGIALSHRLDACGEARQFLHEIKARPLGGFRRVLSQCALGNEDRHVGWWSCATGDAAASRNVDAGTRYRPSSENAITSSPPGAERQIKRRRRNPVRTCPTTRPASRSITAISRFQWRPTYKCLPSGSSTI